MMEEGMTTRVQRFRWAVRKAVAELVDTHPEGFDYWSVCRQVAILLDSCSDKKFATANRVNAQLGIYARRGKLHAIHREGQVLYLPFGEDDSQQTENAMLNPSDPHDPIFGKPENFQVRKMGAVPVADDIDPLLLIPPNGGEEENHPAEPPTDSPIDVNREDAWWLEPSKRQCAFDKIWALRATLGDKLEEASQHYEVLDLPTEELKRLIASEADADIAMLLKLFANLEDAVFERYRLQGTREEVQALARFVVESSVRRVRLAFFSELKEEAGQVEAQKLKKGIAEHGFAFWWKAGKDGTRLYDRDEVQRLHRLIPRESDSPRPKHRRVDPPVTTPPPPPPTPKDVRENAAENESRNPNDRRRKSPLEVSDEDLLAKIRKLGGNPKVGANEPESRRETSVAQKSPWYVSKTARVITAAIILIVIGWVAVSQLGQSEKSGIEVPNVWADSAQTEPQGER